jgi:hypothetical protein
MQNRACFVASHLKTKDKHVIFNQAAQNPPAEARQDLSEFFTYRGPVSRAISP